MYTERTVNVLYEAAMVNSCCNIFVKTHRIYSPWDHRKLGMTDPLNNNNRMYNRVNFNINHKPLPLASNNLSTFGWSIITTYLMQHANNSGERVRGILRLCIEILHTFCSFLCKSKYIKFLNKANGLKITSI